MSSIALSGGLNRSAAIYQSVVGKKIIMAVTGFILFGFILGHMAGNLQIFLPPGPDGVVPLDHYAEKLQALGPLLWVVRGVMLVSVCLHILMAFQLWMMKRQARPLDYLKKASTVSTYASRTMYVSGPLVLLYLIYHLLQFTFDAAAPPGAVEGQVRHNLILAFQNEYVSFFYIVANLLLATHLYHGVWSMFQTLGIGHPKYAWWLRLAAKAFAFVVGIGFCSVPIGVLTGLVK